MIDGAGQKLAFVYFEEEPGRRSAVVSTQREKAAKAALVFED